MSSEPAKKYDTFRTHAKPQAKGPSGDAFGDNPRQSRTWESEGMHRHATERLELPRGMRVTWEPWQSYARRVGDVAIHPLGAQLAVYVSAQGRARLLLCACKWKDLSIVLGALIRHNKPGEVLLDTRTPEPLHCCVCDPCDSPREGWVAMGYGNSETGPFVYERGRSTGTSMSYETPEVGVLVLEGDVVRLRCDNGDTLAVVSRRVIEGQVQLLDAESEQPVAQVVEPPAEAVEPDDAVTVSMEPASPQTAAPVAPKPQRIPRAGQVPPPAKVGEAAGADRVTGAIVRKPAKERESGDKAG